MVISQLAAFVTTTSSNSSDAVVTFSDAKNSEITAKELSDVGGAVASASVTNKSRLMVVMMN